MIDLFQLILGVVASLFKSRARLEAEILVLRQQINVLRRQTPRRPQLNNIDRSLLVWLYRWVPSVLAAVAIIRPETIIRWHRGGFRTLSLLKNVFGPRRGWPLVAADDFHQPRGGRQLRLECHVWKFWKPAHLSKRSQMGRVVRPTPTCRFGDHGGQAARRS
jgi:hypothetical protein